MDKIKVLIAEDSVTQAMQLQNILEVNGYDAAIAANGREALQSIDASRPSIVTMMTIEIMSINCPLLSLMMVISIHERKPGRISLVLSRPNDFRDKWDNWHYQKSGVFDPR